MTTLRLAPSPWRTDTFRRLGERLEKIVGARTAKQFEPLRIWTVGDLMRHLPRRYFSGTELSDLSALRDGEEVAVLAEVVEAKIFASYDRSARKSRLEATITDRRGYLRVTFFGAMRLIDYWHSVLQPGSSWDLRGKGQRSSTRSCSSPIPTSSSSTSTARSSPEPSRTPRSRRASARPLIGLYPLTGKLRTWTVADCASLALDHLAGMADPLPEWLRAEVGLLDLEAAFRAVHQPDRLADIDRGRHRLRFDEAFALQLTMAYRRADAASHRAVPRPRTPAVGCWTPSTPGCPSPSPAVRWRSARRS